MNAKPFVVAYSVRLTGRLCGSCSEHGTMDLAAAYAKRANKQSSEHSYQAMSREAFAAMWANRPV